MEYYDLDYEIQSRLIRSLRAIFEKDKKFRYNENQKETDIKIVLEYPDDENAAVLIPSMVVTGVSAQTNINTTLSYNFYRDIRWNGMKNGAQESFYMFPYSATILCTGAKNESMDVASRVSWYLMFGASEFCNEVMGLRISDISKGNTVPSKQYPDKIFDTPVQIRGNLVWIGTKGPEQTQALYSIDKPLKGFKINFQ